MIGALQMTVLGTAVIRYGRSVQIDLSRYVPFNRRQSDSRLGRLMTAAGRRPAQSRKQVPSWLLFSTPRILRSPRLNRRRTKESSPRCCMNDFPRTSPIGCWGNCIRPGGRTRWNGWQPCASIPREHKRAILQFAASFLEPEVRSLTGLTPANPPPSIHSMVRTEFYSGDLYHCDMIVGTLRGIGIDITGDGRYLDFGASSGTRGQEHAGRLSAGDLAGCDPQAEAVSLGAQQPGQSAALLRVGPQAAASVPSTVPCA